MNLELNAPLVIFDLESTGVNPRFDRIVEFAALKLAPDGSRTTLCFRVNPGRAIPPEASAIHGIRDEDVASCPVFAEKAPQVAEFMAGSDVAGFGIVRFDIPLLRHEFERAGLEFGREGMRVVDALTIYHRLERRDLSAAVSFYCNRQLEDAHSALADTRAALDVLEGQLARYAELPRSIAGLHDFCRPPRDENAIDPEGKLRWRGGEAVIGFGQKSGIPLREMAEREPGYLRWMLNKDFSPEIKAVVRGALEGRFPTR